MTEASIGLNCEELVIVSTHKPEHKSVFYNVNGNYVTSQNCLVLGYGVKTLVITCMYDLRHIVPKVTEFDAEKANLIGEYYLSNKERLQFIAVYIDPNMLMFFQDVFPKNDSIRCRVQNYNPDANQLAAFGVFECSKRHSAMQISQLIKHAPDLKIRDDLTIISNAFSMSFKELFGKTVHKCICSSMTDKGIFIVDFRGYPDIECSLILKKVGKSSEAPCGIIMPGVFHKNNYREYLTLGYSLKHLSDNLGLFLTTYYFKAMDHPRLSRLGMLANQLGVRAPFASPKAIVESGFTNYWIERVVKLGCVNEKTRNFNHASGIIINPRIILTNVHAVDTNHDVKCFVIYKDTRYYCSRLFSGDTSLDYLYIYLESRLPLPESMEDISSVISATNYAGKGEDVFSVGFPLFRLNGGFDCIPFISKGNVLNIYQKSPIKGEILHQPLLILSSVMAFSGSSGGALLDNKGRLLGLVFATVKVKDSINEHVGEAVINELTASIDLRNDFHVVSQLMKLKDPSEDQVLLILKTSKYFHLNDPLVESVCRFENDRPEIADMVRLTSLNKEK